MVRRTCLARIDDMVDAIDAIEKIAQDEGNRPWLAKLARERAFEILSEASRHIPQDPKQTEPGIAWRDIAGLGNVLRHDYQSVDDDILQNAVVRDLAPLRAALHRIMATEERLDRENS